MNRSRIVRLPLAAVAAIVVALCVGCTPTTTAPQGSTVRSYFDSSPATYQPPTYTHYWFQPNPVPQYKFKVISPYSSHHNSFRSFGHGRKH